VKLNLGCGTKILDGWINADIYKLDGVDMGAEEGGSIDVDIVIRKIEKMRLKNCPSQLYEMGYNHAIDDIIELLRGMRK